MNQNSRDSLRSTLNEYFRLCNSCEQAGIDIDDVHNDITKTVTQEGGPQKLEDFLVNTVCCPSCEGEAGESVADGHDCWGKTEFSFIPCFKCDGKGFLPADYKEQEKNERRKMYIQLREEFGHEDI